MKDSRMDNSEYSQFPMMENMTVKSVRKYLTHKKSIIIPIGVIEQHGYHLPLKTDALIAKYMAHKIGNVTGIMVAPTMYQSFSGGTCPGTINISPTTMSLVVNDMLISLVSQGFRNFYLLLCHGGSENTLALDNIVKILLRMNPAFKDVMICLLPIWDCDIKHDAYKKGFAEKDWHAGWVETSLVMAIEPVLVQMDELKIDKEPLISLLRESPNNYQQTEKIVDDYTVVPHITQRPEIEVGVMGYPEKASVEIGRKIIANLLEGAVAKITELESKADDYYGSIEITSSKKTCD